MPIGLFNREGARINFGAAPWTRINTSGLATVSFLMRTKIANGRCCIMSNWVSNSVWGWALLLNHDGNQNKIWLSGYSGLGIVPSTTMNDGAWHSVILLLSKTGTPNNAVYVDGASGGTSATGFSQDNEYDFLLGDNSDAYWSAYGGDIAELAYWDGVHLDADEIAALSGAGGKPYVSPLRIRPAARKFYAPMVASYQNLHSGAAPSQTDGFSMSDPHPRVIGSPAGIGRPVRPDTCTWNSVDQSGRYVLSNGNRTATKIGTNSEDSCIRGTRPLYQHESGYFEVVVVDSDTSPGATIGVANAAARVNALVGGDAHGWAYAMSSGNKVNNGAGAAYGGSWTDGTVIGVAYKNGKIWFAKNNVWQASGDPAAGTGEAFSGITGMVYPAVGLYREFSPTQDATGRWKTTDFTYSPPSGFDPWALA